MEERDSHKYDDIIDLEHPTSVKHKRMSMLERAAQFSPFSALTGYEAVVDEKARLTDEKIELDEDVKTLIDEKLIILQEKLRENAVKKPEVVITYFVPDEKKSGGKYIDVSGDVKK